MVVSQIIDYWNAIVENLLTTNLSIVKMLITSP